MSSPGNSRGRSQSAISHASMYDEFRATAILPPRRYILMTGDQSSSFPFGFGSASPARPPPRYSNVPGPGKYDPQEVNDRTESNRGLGLGFTSIVPRRLEFVRGNKNPAPNAYSPHKINRKIQPQIGIIPSSRKKQLFPGSVTKTDTPGPGAYNFTQKRKLTPSSIFKSKTERNYLPGPPKGPPKFDGRNFVLSAID